MSWADAAAELDSAQDLYEHAPCGYLSTAPDGTLAMVNQTFLDWTGFARADLVGKRRFQDLLTPGGRIYHETHVAPLMRMQGAVREIACEIACPGGSRLPVLVNSTMRFRPDGEPIAIRTTVFNATDRRRYEQELLRSQHRAQDSERRVLLLQRAAGMLTSAATVADVVRAVEDALTEAVGEGAGLSWEMSGEGHAAAAGAIAVQLVAADRPAATVHVSLPEGRVLTDEELQLVAALGSQAGPALERARAAEYERVVADTLQAALLAGDPPDDPRFSVATAYLPAVEALDVGGDWYDVFALGADRVGVVVGDVVGRGVEAAATMGQLRSAIRAVAGFQVGPALVLQRLDGFVKTLRPAFMATVAYAEIELSTGAVQYACAGHPPPAVLAADGATRVLWDGRSLPLGFDQERTEGDAQLAAGDALVLYTDGLVERRGESLDAGIERMEAALAGHAGEPLPELLKRLTRELLEDVATQDDVCVLCVRISSVR